MRNLWTIIVVILGVFLLLGAGLNVGYEQAEEAYTVENESILIDYSQEVSVNTTDVNGYNETVDIYYNSTELADGTDYEWYEDRGNVSWYNTTSTTERETAMITYEYYDQPEETTVSRDVVGIIQWGIVFLLLYAGAKFALGGVDF